MIDQLSPVIILGIIIGYFILLMGIAYYTSKNDNNQNFFTANRNSNWMMVAFGMIGASLSGVTFISIPGVVGAGGTNQAFAYMQMVFGYVVGYAVIALILLPIYYKYQLTSIYTFLGKKLGNEAYKTGAAYFLLSRVIGASFRLFLVAIVLQRFVMEAFGVPFPITVLITIALIWIYTFKGGIKTIVVTDTIQTVFMLLAVVLTISAICNALGGSFMDSWDKLETSGYTKTFFFDAGWSDPNNFFKHFFSGMLITIVMTGLDQDMMQKNLTCRNLKDAQKNMFSFSIVLIAANFLFLIMGGMLYLYANSYGLTIPEKTDYLFPTLALQHLPVYIGVVFIIGLIAAAYSSADSALTALTTSFCIDFLDFEKYDQEDKWVAAALKKKRRMVHIGFSALLFLVIMGFWFLNDQAVINSLFKIAGYTYGPLLGLFTFAIVFKHMRIRKYGVIIVCILAPIISIIVDKNSENLLFGFKFGFLILLFNGLITFLGLFALSTYDDLTEQNKPNFIEDHLLD